MCNRRGFTLLELVLVLLVLGTITTLVVPRFGHARDVVAVRAARAELAAAFAVARVTAIRSGGAAIVIDVASGDVWVETAAGLRLPADYPLGHRYGVTLSCDRTSPVVLRYDALGLGRLTNAVIRVQRRGVRASLTISSYGRVRT
jgi:prepilin-type N-terminal cleavage/methylation domain-containing protein